jgi:ribonuclease P protein component
LTTGSLKKFTLGARERLKSRKKIQLLFTKGKSLTFAPFRVIYQIQDDASSLQVGAAVSTRQFKKAVDRNRIKRLIREAYRLQKNQLKDLLISRNKGMDLFIIYNGKTLPEYPFVFQKTGEIIQKIVKEIHALD